MRKIEVVDYNPAWPDLFAAERNLLQQTLDGVVVRIHHIGSTSVPGLAAKPIIDILMEVTDVEELDSYTNEMLLIGYEALGEYGIPGRRFFRKGGDNRTHHIHAFAAGDYDVIRHIAFRDYLRENPEVAAEYAKLKKNVAAECNNDSEKYCDGKDEFVKFHESLALSKFQPNF